MKRKLRILSSIILTLVLLLCTASVPVSASSTLNVTVEPSVIDITITPTVSLAINPNLSKGESGYLSFNSIEVVNNSKCPVSVTCTGLTEEPDSWFKLVPKDKYSNWKELSREQSRDIAIGLKMEAGWKTINAAYWSTSNPSTYMNGVLNAGDTGTIVLSETNSAYGTSFDSPRSSSFLLNFIITLL